MWSSRNFQHNPQAFDVLSAELQNQISSTSSISATVSYFSPFHSPQTRSTAYADISHPHSPPSKVHEKSHTHTHTQNLHSIKNSLLLAAPNGRKIALVWLWRKTQIIGTLSIPHQVDARPGLTRGNCLSFKRVFRWHQGKNSREH